MRFLDFFVQVFVSLSMYVYAYARIYFFFMVRLSVVQKMLFLFRIFLFLDMNSFLFGQFGVFLCFYFYLILFIKNVGVLGVMMDVDNRVQCFWFELGLFIFRFCISFFYIGRSIEDQFGVMENIGDLRQVLEDFWILFRKFYFFIGKMWGIRWRSYFLMFVFMIF